MTRYAVPSTTRPGVEYELCHTDDGGIVCECQGYSQKVAVSYVTGVRHHIHALCRHAKQIVFTHDIHPKQPFFYWSSLADGDTFPITDRVRGEDEHMLAYQYDGILEPLESAKDDIFPRHAAKPDRDLAGRFRDLIRTPVRELVISTTGNPPTGFIKTKAFRQQIRSSGATINPGAVNAHTTVLAVGDEPNHRRISRAQELLTPMVDFTGLIAILHGRHNEATDLNGIPIIEPRPEQNITPIGIDYRRFITHVTDLQSNWVDTLENQHLFHQSLQDSASAIDRLLTLFEDSPERPMPIAESIKTLAAIRNMLRGMADDTISVSVEPPSNSKPLSADIH